MPNIGIQQATKLLNGDVHGRQILCPGPNHSQRDRSLSVRIEPDSKDGFLVHSFAGDDFRLCREHVKERLGLQPSFNSNNAQRTFTNPDFTANAGGKRSNNDYALKIWHQSQPPESTPVEHYLSKRIRGFNAHHLSASSIRYHPACPFTHLMTKDRFQKPAMIALLVDVQTGEPRAIHRTAIMPDGSGKAEMPDLNTPKRMLGSSKNCAVMLSPSVEVTMGLNITEGIETGFSVLSLGISPLWCVCSTSNMKKFPVLHGIESLTIYGDNDRNKAGEKAAIDCAKQWRDAQKECRIILPRTIGSDWNDTLLEAGNV